MKKIEHEHEHLEKLFAYKPEGSNGWWVVGTAEEKARGDSTGTAVLYKLPKIEKWAKLLAAAPELLEALMTAFVLLEEHQPAWYLRRHYNIFKAAIAKAGEGGED